MTANARFEVEAARQRTLLTSLLARDPGALLERMRGNAERIARGLAAHAGHLDAAAERALAASFPTVQALLGESSFAALAHAYRDAHPPVRGDLSRLGEALPDFIAASARLANVPYLADCARLDWLVACAEAAADAVFEPESLALLDALEPARLALELRPGSALLASRYPVATIREAHRDAVLFERARAALRAGQGESVFVWRDAGWRARSALLADDERRFMAALLEAGSLGSALDGAGAGFDFAAWLARALASGWLWRVRRYTRAAASP